MEAKDVLHYYLGCEYAYLQKDGSHKFFGNKLNFSAGYKLHSSFISGRLKLVLRPLSSMTEDEVLTAFHISYEDAKYEFSECTETSNGWKARNQNGMECYLPTGTFKPGAFHYLLSRGFDLFGLIPSGAAVEKVNQDV